MIIARSPNNDLQVISDADAANYIPKLANRNYQFYRVEPQGDGNFLLVLQRAKPGTVVREQRIVSVVLEDDI